MNKLALVIPWYGQHLRGGAESQARELAERLARHYDITVLTTCCRSFQDDWGLNQLAAGVHSEGGVRVHRFPVRARNRLAFDRVVSKLLALTPAQIQLSSPFVSEEDEAVYMEENIRSPELVAYLRQARHDFTAFIFLPYLFPDMVDGVAAVAGRAVLQPCLHDEVYAYLPRVRAAFLKADRLFFNSNGECELALRLFGPGIAGKSRVVGEGIEWHGLEQHLGHAASEAAKVAGPYILYLGKRCREKNVHSLLNYFSDFVAAHPDTDCRLVLAGSDPLPIDVRDPRVIDLGLVSEADKWNLLRHCRALVNPSVNESFSRIIFEAWMAGKPVLVHRDCLATYRALLDSGGVGRSFRSSPSFAESLGDLLLLGPADAARLGVMGRTFAEHTANWSEVVRSYQRELTDLADQGRILETWRTGLAGTTLGGRESLTLAPPEAAAKELGEIPVLRRSYARQLGLDGDDARIRVVAFDDGETTSRELLCSTVDTFRHIFGPDLLLTVLGSTAEACSEVAATARRAGVHDLVAAVPCAEAAFADAMAGAAALLSVGTKIVEPRLVIAAQRAGVVMVGVETDETSQWIGENQLLFAMPADSRVFACALYEVITDRMTAERARHWGIVNALRFTPELQAQELERHAVAAARAENGDAGA